MLPLMRDKQKERSKNRTPILYQPIPKQNQPSNSWKPTKTITLFETELSHVQAHQNHDRAFPFYLEFERNGPREKKEQQPNI